MLVPSLFRLASVMSSVMSLMASCTLRVSHSRKAIVFSGDFLVVSHSGKEKKILHHYEKPSRIMSCSRSSVTSTKPGLSALIYKK